MAEDFTELVERHRAELRVHCYRLQGSFEAAEDLVQETFLRAWKGIEGFQGRSSTRAWLALGGADLAGGLMWHDLIDEYRLYVHPVAIGRGTPLFPTSDARIGLRTQNLVSLVPAHTLARRDRTSDTRSFCRTQSAISGDT